MEKEKYQITQEGYDEYKKEYERLSGPERDEVIKEVAAARAQGDLSENADLDAASEKLAKLTARIEYLDNLLQNAEIVSKKGSKIVRIGSTVTVTNVKTKKQSTVKIVGQVESDPLNNRISSSSPFGLAVMDHKVGDQVTVNANKTYDVKIDKIS